MAFPGENDYRAERLALLATIESLTDEEFDHGTTLCAGWAPRDVVAHLMGIDSELGAYVRALGQINKANDEIVQKARALDRPAVMARLRTWANSPALTSRTIGLYLIADLAIHHQDILRGLGRTREVPKPASDAILREGALLGLGKLRHHRVVPNDGGRSFGRGDVVSGTSEALGMWLCGREAVADELVFTGAITD